MDRHHVVASSAHGADNALIPLLDQAARLGPEYGAGLSSHLPMALCALSALGADEARLHEFFDRSARSFAPPVEPAAPDSRLSDWRSHRGRLDAFEPLAAHFRSELQAEGADAVLRQVLPDLVPGVAAAAFHGLIRTAYAAETRHPAELASALAYWACRWLPLSRPADGATGLADTGPLGFDAWSAGLLAARTLPRPDGRLITDRIERVVGTAAYAELGGRLQVDRATLPRLAALAIERYGASRNFTVLHLVTGSHALRVLLPWLGDPALALGHFVDAFAAAYLVSGIAPQAPPMPPAGLDWPTIVARAIASDDDHVIKLVHSCREEAALYGDAAYRQAAGLVVT